MLPLHTEVTIPLKYLSNFYKCLDLHLIKCEVELDFKWSRNWVLIEDDDNIKGGGFIINNTKLCVPVVPVLSMMISNF